MVNFMQIDARKLNEVIPKMARRKIKNERFYAVPNAKGYALSDYGRLVYGNKWVPLVRKKNNEIYCDYYRIKFDDNDTKILVRVDKLVAMVFRPNEKIYCLVNLRWLNGKNKNRHEGLFKVEKLHVIRNKDELVDYIRSKIEGIEPTYAGAKEDHGFIFRNEYKRPISLVIAKTYISMKYRVGKLKHYEDVKLSDEWASYEPFVKWYLNNNYYYPEPLTLDKDLLHFGTSRIYSPETCCLLPSRINAFFSGSSNKNGIKIEARKKSKGKYSFSVKGEHYNYFPNYYDALQYARKVKAEQIREIVKEEREKGFMPECLLNKMSQWADLAEIGLIKMWEPDVKALIEKGII